MGNVFNSLNAYPNYGDRMVRLVWSMQPGHEGGRFIIFKSSNGANGWEEIGKVDNLHEFTDPNLHTGSRLAEAYYRVIQQKPKQRNDSDVVGIFGRATRQQFCAARYIMDQEYKALRAFSEVLIYKVRLGGPNCPRCTDSETGQKTGTSLCQVCYGTGYDGGYLRPPIQSHLRVMNTSTNVKLDRADGAGTDDPSTAKFRMLAFPLVEKEDLLVLPGMDDRYVVDTVDYGYVAGKIPVVATVMTQLLRRDDIRYKVKA